MSRISRLTRPALLLLPLALFAAACAAPGSAPSSGGEPGQVVSIGVADAGENYWNVYKQKAAEAGITVDFVNFTDYNQPNPALSQGQLQLNQFQHLQYLANYNVKNPAADNGDALVPIGATAVYPLPLYSTKHTSVDQIPDGGQVVIPNDPTNQARALLVLQAAGLVTLRGGGNSLSTPNEIESAKVEVVPVDAAQTATNIQSVDAAIVNNNYATAANLNEQRIFADDPNSDSSKPYINAFVSRAEDKDNPVYLQLAALYHDPDVEAAIRADLGDTGVFKTNDAADLQATTTQIENDLRATGA